MEEQLRLSMLEIFLQLEVFLVQLNRNASRSECRKSETDRMERKRALYLLFFDVTHWWVPWLLACLPCFLVCWPVLPRSLLRFCWAKSPARDETSERVEERACVLISGRDCPPSSSSKDTPAPAAPASTSKPERSQNGWADRSIE